MYNLKIEIVEDKNEKRLVPKSLQKVFYIHDVKQGIELITLLDSNKIKSINLNKVEYGI